MWKCCEGSTAVMHTHCDNDSATTCSDQVSLLGCNGTDNEVQRNPAYNKDVTQVRKQTPPKSQRTLRFPYMMQSIAPPVTEVAEVVWIDCEPSTHMGNESKEAKEATDSLPTCPQIGVDKSGDLPRHQHVGSLIRPSTSFNNASVGRSRKKKVTPRAKMPLVDENEFRGKVASNRYLYNRSLSN
jgi:hypothetical protein